MNKSQRLFSIPPKVLEAKDGVITRIKRGRDKMEMFVGQDTESGGKIVSFHWDTNYGSDMYVVLSASTAHVALSAICLPYEK